MNRMIGIIAVFVLLAIIIILVMVIIPINHNNADADQSKRPLHCIEGQCLEAWRFDELPEYPEDLERVAVAVSHNKLLVSENFSETLADEHYYKQPEWYAPDDKVFDNQGLPLYIELINKINAYNNMTEEEKQNAPPLYTSWYGWGAYPGSLIISELEPGQTAKTITFIRNGWAIVKYQEFVLNGVFPDEPLGCKSAGYNEIINPVEAEKYFDVSITPNEFLLTPTYPEFTYDWAEKVEIEITAHENTPPGKYVMGLEAGSVSPEQHDKNFRKYWGSLIDGAKRGGYPYTVCINVV